MIAETFNRFGKITGIALPLLFASAAAHSQTETSVYRIPIFNVEKTSSGFVFNITNGGQVNRDARKHGYLLFYGRDHPKPKTHKDCPKVQVTHKDVNHRYLNPLSGLTKISVTVPDQQRIKDIIKARCALVRNPDGPKL